MSKKPNPTRIDDDNPEWKAADVKAALPLSGLSATLQAKLRRARVPNRGRPQI